MYRGAEIVQSVAYSNPRRLSLRILLHVRRRSASIETTTMTSSSSSSRLQLVVGILISKLPRRQITVDPNKASSPLTRGRQRFPGRGWRNTASRWLLRQRLRRRASSTIYPPIATLCEASVIDALPASTTLPPSHPLSISSSSFAFSSSSSSAPLLLLLYLCQRFTSVHPSPPSLSPFLFRLSNPKGCTKRRPLLFTYYVFSATNRNWKVPRAWISLIRNQYISSIRNFVSQVFQDPSFPRRVDARRSSESSSGNLARGEERRS